MAETKLEVGDRVEHRGSFGYVMASFASGVCVVQLDAGNMRSVESKEVRLVEPAERPAPGTTQP